MRTTVDIDDDILLAVKELARTQHTSTGKVLSSLVRRALTSDTVTGNLRQDQPPLPSGFRPFPRRAGVIVTNEDINRLRDVEGV